MHVTPFLPKMLDNDDMQGGVASLISCWCDSFDMRQPRASPSLSSPFVSPLSPCLKSHSCRHTNRISLLADATSALFLRITVVLYCLRPYFTHTIPSVMSVYGYVLLDITHSQSAFGQTKPLNMRPFSQVHVHGGIT